MQPQTKAEALSNAKKSLHEITRELMTAIAKGTFKPGERLVELQLCELCDVKRSRIREALRKLEHDGFVKIVPNVGAVVSKFSRQDIVEMYDLLSVVEGMAVKIATPFITPEQLTRLQIILDKSETTDDVSLFTEYNNEFHHLLDSYCENRRLMKITENLRLGINAFGFRSFLAPGQIDASILDHKKIMQAIKENKPDKAEKLMRQHLIDAKSRLLGWIYKTL
jgi:DNA-binding GntR family transcriptional regulator